MIGGLPLAAGVGGRANLQTPRAFVGRSWSLYSGNNIDEKALDTIGVCGRTVRSCDQFVGQYRKLRIRDYCRNLIFVWRGIHDGTFAKSAQSIVFQQRWYRFERGTSFIVREFKVFFGQRYFRRALKNSVSI